MADCGQRPSSSESQLRAAAKTGVPYGISAVNSLDAHRVGKLFDTSNPTLNAYTNPNTSGVTFRTSWADVEPQEGQVDFSKIDTVFANAEKNGKWVELILIPGFGTPGWALQGVESGTFTIAYGPGHGTLLPLPVPWDQTYLARWFTFLQVIGDRYGARLRFERLPRSTRRRCRPRCHYLIHRVISLSGKDWAIRRRSLGAWQRTFSACSSIFPHQYFSLALHPALPIPNGKRRAMSGSRCSVWDWNTAANLRCKRTA